MEPTQFVPLFRQFAPAARQDIVEVIARRWDAAIAAGITTPLRFMHAMAQFAHESSGFSKIEENMNYSAERMWEVFGPTKRRKARNGLTLAKARQLDAAGPRATANFLYGGAWGKKELGNTEPNDGYDYRGSGLLQETGRANFKARAEETGMPLEENPELLRQPEGAWLAACASWAARGCNEAADVDDVDEVTRRINPGMQGLEDRRKWLSRARRVFATSVAPGPIVATEEPAGGWMNFGHYNDAGMLAVQRRLYADAPAGLGYKSVRLLDGTWGPSTIGALAEFRAINDIPDVQADPMLPRIDRRTYDVLMRLDAKPWVPSAERTALANSKAEDIAKVRPKLIGGAIATRSTGRLATAGTIGSAVVVGVSDQLGPSYSKLSILANFITSPWTMGAVIIALALALWLYGGGGIATIKNAIRTGEAN